MDFSLVRACLTILLELPEYAAVFDCGVTQLKDLWVVVDVGEGVEVGAPGPGVEVVSRQHSLRKLTMDRDACQLFLHSLVVQWLAYYQAIMVACLSEKIPIQLLLCAFNRWTLLFFSIQCMDFIVFIQPSPIPIGQGKASRCFRVCFYNQCPQFLMVPQS